jgi:hypothetical protein
MYLLALTIKAHTTVRLEELAGLLTAVAGAAMLAPLGMLGGRRLSGLALAAAGVLWIVALHWGRAR